MTGIYLAQLAAAVLAEQGRIDASLAAAALPTLAHFETDPPDKVKRRPLGVVSLVGDQAPTRRPQGYSEVVPVMVKIELDANEGAALMYLGVVKATLLGSDLAAQVTDAKLSDWALAGSSLSDDRARRNVATGAWLVTVRMQATIQF